MINYEDLTLKQIEQSFSKKPGLKKAMKDLRLILNNNEKSKKQVGLEGITFSSEQLKDGSYSYTARVYVYNSEGKRTQKPFTCSTVKEARKRAYDYQQNELIFKNGKYYFHVDQNDTPTVSEWLDIYIKSLTCKEVTKKDYESNRQRYLINAPEELPQLADIPITEVTPDHVELLKSSMLKLGYKSETINKFKNLVSSSFRYAIIMKRLKENIFRSIDGVEEDRSVPEFLLDDELYELINVSKNNPIEVFLNVLGFTGVRFGEGRGLRWKDINFKTGEINIRKQINKSSGLTPTSLKTPSSIRTIECDPEMPLFGMLLGLKVKQQQEQPDKSFNENRLVFSHPDGKPFSEQYYRRRFKKLQSKLSFQKDTNWGFHTLRHTWITLNLKMGEDIKKVSRWAGHKSVKITYDVYSHAIPGEGKKASTNFNAMVYANATK